jgi:hypothetical protein
MNRITLVALLASLLNGCGEACVDPISFQIHSADTESFLAQCVSQNWDNAFPRFFPMKGQVNRTFRTYNRIVVSIVPEEQGQLLVARTPVKLTPEMVAYLRKCAAFPGRV